MVIKEINPKEHPDSFDSFSNWYLNSFIARNSGFQPKNLEKWFDKTNNRKENIRALIGGVRNQQFVKLESHQENLSLESAAGIINDILNILPGYLGKYNFTQEVFLSPFISQGEKRGARVSKHILQYANKNIASKEKFAILEKRIAELGQLWASHKTNDVEMECTISTSARAFCLLGHYGPDEASCFRQGSDKTQDKYCVAQTSDTFIISVAQKNTEKNKYQPVARCFGFYTILDRKPCFHLANWYISLGVTEGDVSESIKLALEKICGKKLKKHPNVLDIYDSSEDAPRTSGIWYNKTPRISFCDVELADNLVYYTASVDTQGIKILTCQHCHTNIREALGVFQVDEYHTVCSTCYQASNYCELSGKRTFKDLIPVLLEDDSIRSGLPEVAHELGINCECQSCGTLSRENLKLGTRDVCRLCHNELMENCDVCGKEGNIDEFVYDRDVLSCPQCREQWAIAE